MTWVTNSGEGVIVPGATGNWSPDRFPDPGRLDVRRVPRLRVAAPRDTIPFKDDGIVYGVYELPVAW
ncbi:hypothetical protein ABZ725_13265 [Streptomyces sp. NPDC006872]|uniref:hypothetical protein n=1 Tax=Streptomyces sp. NPDC006872 TaxID=3155720 RepID=UPI0033D083E1